MSYSMSYSMSYYPSSTSEYSSKGSKKSSKSTSNKSGKSKSSKSKSGKSGKRKSGKSKSSKSKQGKRNLQAVRTFEESNVKELRQEQRTNKYQKRYEGVSRHLRRRIWEQSVCWMLWKFENCFMWDDWNIYLKWVTWQFCLYSAEFPLWEHVAVE